ncbi:hypothetical protein SRHO_G00266450 [Serrasalmus rhombeus]
MKVSRRRTKQQEKREDSGSKCETTHDNTSAAGRGDSQSPTAQIALAKAESEVELLKLKVASQQEKIKDLEEERDFLRTQLTQVCVPAEVIRRYEKVLAIYMKGNTMAKSFQKYGVDRNTIAQTASIAELSLAAPETYRQLNDDRGKKEKLLDFAKKCQDVIASDKSIAEKISNMKVEGKLLPIQKKSRSDSQPSRRSRLCRRSSVSGCDVSQNAELQCSDGLTELELGTDEVFVISSGPNTAGPPFSPHTQRERFLRHSDTGPAQPSDWPTPDSSALSTSSRGGHVGSVVSARPRAWSVPNLPRLPATSPSAAQENV